VRQLDELYPQLREEERAPAPTSTIGAPVEHLDLATVIKVSQAMSAEMVLEKLVDTIMRTAIENAGDYAIWEYPSGERLMRVAFDHERRLSLYRAPANVCNSCSLKRLCAASDKGREIEQSPDSWLKSELSRFRRGISLSLLLLTAILLTIEMIRHQGAVELLVMGSLLLATTFALFGLFSLRARARAETVSFG
jgi:hypothetical protein